MVGLARAAGSELSEPLERMNSAASINVRLAHTRAAASHQYDYDYHFGGFVLFAAHRIESAQETNSRKGDSFSRPHTVCVCARPLNRWSLRRLTRRRSGL